MSASCSCCMCLFLRPLIPILLHSDLPNHVPRCRTWWKSTHNCNLLCLLVVMFVLLQIKVCFFASPNCEMLPLPEPFFAQHLFSLWKSFSIDLNWLLQESLASSMQIVSGHLLCAAEQYKGMLLVEMCSVCISNHVSLYWCLVWSCFQSTSKWSINAFFKNVLRRN